MKRRSPPPTLRRILVEFGVLAVLHFTLLCLLSRMRVMEHLLAPGPGSRVALALTAAFLLLRFFLLVLAPGWLLARLWLLFSRSSLPRQSPPLADAKTEPTP
jgi:hypothetical protein